MEEHDNNQTFRYGLIGASGTGKTTMLMKLVINRVKTKNIKNIYYFTKTGLEFSKNIKQRYLKNVDVKTFGNDLRAIMIVLQLHNRTQTPGIIIFDDFIDVKIAEREEIAVAFGSARHSNLDLYFTAQAGTRVLSRFMLSNMTHIKLFRNSVENVKSLFGSIIMHSNPDEPDKEFNTWKNHVFTAQGKHNFITYDVEEHKFYISANKNI